VIIFVGRLLRKGGTGGTPLTPLDLFPLLPNEDLRLARVQVADLENRTRLDFLEMGALYDLFLSKTGTSPIGEFETFASGKTSTSGAEDDD